METDDIAYQAQGYHQISIYQISDRQNPQKLKTFTLKGSYESSRIAGGYLYARNVIAANLRTGRSHTVGVLVDQMVSPYAARIIKGINRVMREHGIYVVTCDADNDPSIERDYLNMVKSSFFDGLIVAHCNNADNSGLFKELNDRALPMVFLRSSLDGLDAPVVCVNSYDKGFFLVDHLVCSGRRRIVNVKGPSLSGEVRDLDKAYVDVMNKFGIPVIAELQLSAGVDMLSGREVADRLIDSGVDFDAVFAINEIVAIGVMNRLMERGVKVPDDVSVAAFTGSMLSEMVYPSMTSVEAPLEEMGRRAAELLVDMINHPGVRHSGIIIDARIRIRQSSDITQKPAL